MKFLVVDEQALFRDGIEMIISAYYPKAKVYHASDRDEMNRLSQRYSFDLVLVDIAIFQSLDGWQKALRIFLKTGVAKSVCIVSELSVRGVQQAFEMGVKGYITKHVGKHEMYQAISEVLKGQLYVSHHSWKQLRELANSDQVVITKRQKEILSLMVNGLSNKKIGDELHISESTVKRHLYNLFKLLKVHNRVEALHYVRKLGVICD